MVAFLSEFSRLTATVTVGTVANVVGALHATRHVASWAVKSSKQIKIYFSKKSRLAFNSVPGGHPFSQLSPVTPGGQMHSPVTGLQVPPLVQLHKLLQPRPQNPCKSNFLHIWKYCYVPKFYAHLDKSHCKLCSSNRLYIRIQFVFYCTDRRFYNRRKKIRIFVRIAQNRTLKTPSKIFFRPKNKGKK